MFPDQRHAFQNQYLCSSVVIQWNISFQFIPNETDTVRASKIITGPTSMYQDYVLAQCTNIIIDSWVFYRMLRFQCLVRKRPMQNAMQELFNNCNIAYCQIWDRLRQKEIVIPLIWRQGRQLPQFSVLLSTARHRRTLIIYGYIFVNVSVGTANRVSSSFTCH